MGNATNAVVALWWRQAVGAVVQTYLNVIFVITMQAALQKEHDVLDSTQDSSSRRRKTRSGKARPSKWRRPGSESTVESYPISKKRKQREEASAICRLEDFQELMRNAEERTKEQHAQLMDIFRTAVEAGMEDSDDNS